MPRIYTSANDPLDFCEDCFPSESTALDQYGDVGDGPDGRGNCFGYDCEHPDYGQENYKCDICHKKLTTEDN